MNRSQYTALLSFLIMGFCTCTTSNVLNKGDKILFIGDSITQQGEYVRLIERHLKTNHKDLNLKTINAGLSSENVTGLSEPIHNPKRPFLFDRLENILRQENPDLVFFCYGINDGMYHPFADSTITAFQAGVDRFISITEQYTNKIILLSPTPYAASEDLMNKLKAADDGEYSWKTPYYNYDKEVIQKLKKYILSVNHPSVLTSIDLHASLIDNKSIAYDYDPIHPNKTGHKIMSDQIILYLDLIIK